MIESKKPILSICIPTYNRGGYLYFTLKSIVEQEIFKNTYDVEIVVSDNVSSDLTEQIVKMFIEKFPDKIFYNKNDTNIGGDKNFEKVLTLGHGEVLKLHNDNFFFSDNSLEKMVAKIKELRETKPTIFFSNNNSRTGDSKLCNNLDELVETLSCATTWISSFSMWKEKFDSFEDFSKNVQTFLMQTDVLFRLIAKGEKIFVYDERLFEEQSVYEKGGYNISKVFGQNYLSLLKEYLGKNLSKSVYEKEKKRVLFDHIIPTRFVTAQKHKGYSFSSDGYWRHLKNDYWYNLYFYTSIFQILHCHFNVFLYKLSRLLNPFGYQKYWKKRNFLNKTTISKKVDASKIFVGSNSLGNIDVRFTNNPKEVLIIENDVSIGEGVNFVFGSTELIIIKEGTQIAANTIVTASI